MNGLKYAVSVLITVAMLAMLSACVSSEPCESCGGTPTKAYTNNYSGEKEYYCSDCSLYCDFCSNKATEYYTSGFGNIIFVCNDHYKQVQEFNQ